MHSGGMLLGRQAEVAGKFAAVLEALDSTTDKANDGCGGDEHDSRNAPENLDSWGLLGDGFEVRLELFDIGFEGSDFVDHRI